VEGVRGGGVIAGIGVNGGLDAREPGRGGRRRLGEGGGDVVERGGGHPFGVGELGGVAEDRGSGLGFAGLSGTIHGQAVDLLLGPVNTWRDRSLLGPGITAHYPILAFHGDQDTITPLRQVRELVATLGARISLVVYPDEGHGLSRPKNIEHATYAELAHYRAALDC
jgi:hypothetical protein